MAFRAVPQLVNATFRKDGEKVSPDFRREISMRSRPRGRPRGEWQRFETEISHCHIATILKMPLSYEKGAVLQVLSGLYRTEVGLRDFRRSNHALRHLVDISITRRAGVCKPARILETPNDELSTLVVAWFHPVETFASLEDFGATRFEQGEDPDRDQMTLGEHDGADMRLLFRPGIPGIVQDEARDTEALLDDLLARIREVVEAAIHQSAGLPGEVFNPERP